MAPPSASNSRPSVPAGASPAPRADAGLPPKPGNTAPPAVTPGSRPQAGRWRAVALAVLFAGLAGGAGWWWINSEPAPISGRVLLSGDETGAVEIRVFQREDLSASWRELLAAAEVRAAELAELSAEALARHRQAWLAYDEASRVCAVGEEYNMPDLAELRAEREAKQAGEVAAMEELKRLSAEKQGLVTLEGLLGVLPAPLQTVTADAQGIFALPPPEGTGVVLVAVSPSGSDGGIQLRGWFEVLELEADGRLPDTVELSGEDQLEVDAIRRFVAGDDSR